MDASTVNLALFTPPHQYEYGSHRPTNIGAVLRKLAIDTLHGYQHSRLVRTGSYDYAVVVGDPRLAGQYNRIWRDPTKLAAFGLKYGDNAGLNFANCLRMLRMTARTGFPSSYLVEHPELLVDEVEVRTDDDFEPWPWGDVRLSGAVMVGEPDDPYRLPVAFAGLSGEENEAFATFFGMMLRLRMRAADQPVVA